MLKVFVVLIAMVFAVSVYAGTESSNEIEFLKLTLDHTLKTKDKRVDDWKKRYTEIQDKETENWIQLLGYQPPDFLIHIAVISSYLYEKTDDMKYAEITRDVLVSHAGYRDYFPDRLKNRVEYKEGVPVVNWFRMLPKYIDSYLRTKESGLYSKSDIEVLKESVAASVDIIFAFPEWGAMNRAMLRAESLMAAAVLFPDHPHADKWRKMSEILASDSIGKWEIEDAQIYHPVWLRPYIHYLDLTGQQHLFQFPVMKFYFDYFVALMAPNRAIPEFGDGRWMDNLDEYYLVLERGAKEYRSGEMKWTANCIFETICKMVAETNTDKDVEALYRQPNTRLADLLISRDAYMDKTITPKEPRFLSGDAIDEVISKKIIFRSDWGEDATYMLLNYKDEGYYSIMQKNYLKHILAVEEEKMHHGHSDENSICLLMKNGSVLLSDGSYREMAPSGEYGAFRADIFHNRIAVRNVKKYMTQPYFDVLRNSGAYNDQVRTSKLDFQDFREIQYSRTRLEDMKHHYRWDRILTRHKEQDYFIMVDALKFFKSDYYTIANILHAQNIVEKGKDWYVTRFDQLAGKYPNAGDMDLLIYFPQDKFTGEESERRDLQEEVAIFQGESQYYDAGKIESFITVLVPLKRGTDPKPIIRKFEVVRDDITGAGILVKDGKTSSLYGFKLDLDMDLLKEDVRPRYNYDSGKIEYDKVETDADMFYLQTGDGVPRFSATHLVKFVYDGKVLFDTPESQFFQVWGKSDRKGRAKWRRWENE